MKQDLQGVFVIYSRKSKFTGKGESVENQVEMCRNYIASVYGPEAAEAALVYEDEGFSGGNLERPQFKKMMKDSHEQKFAAIVVYRLDRISRNIGDFAKLIEDLGDRKIDFISIREQFDTSSPMGRAMMYIASVFSQLERETIAERIRDNMHELAKTGRWLGGNTPTGYESEGVTSVAVDGKAKKAYKLKPIPEEISLVKKIFDLFMETGSLTKVDQYLLERQIKTKTGKNFSRFSIRAILANPVYMIADEDAYDYMVENQADLFSEKDNFDGVHGIMAYNRTLQRPGQANKTNPIDEWIVAVGKHPGIIPGAAWIAVQEKLELNKVKSYRGPRGNVALLSGLLYCGHCGDYMRPKVTNRKNAQGETIYTYMCTMKERSRGQVCKIKNVSGNLLDAKIVQAVKDLGRNSDEMAQQIMQTKRVLRGDLEGYNAQLEEVRTQIEETDRQVKGLVDTLSRTTGTSAEKYIVERIDELNKASDAQRRRLEELESLTKQHELADMEFDIIQNMLANFSEGIENYSVEQKRAAIRAVVKKVVWDGENVHLYLFGRDGDVDFPEIPAKNGENETFSESESAWREDSECYPLPSALLDGKENPPLSRNNAPTSKWIFWSRESGSFFLLQRVSCEGRGLTPLYILQVTLAGPRTTVEAQAFYRMYHSYADIPNPWDRLRWCRYGLDLLQKEVAAMVGMEEWLYRDLESGAFHRSFTPELADKLAALYGIPVEDILDDYTLFLHRGGGDFLRRYRKTKSWNRQQLADHAKVS